MCWSVCCVWNSFTILQDKHRAASGQIYGPLLFVMKYYFRALSKKRNHSFGVLMVSRNVWKTFPGMKKKIYSSGKNERIKIGDFEISYFILIITMAQQWLNWLIFLTLLIHSCGVSWLDKLIAVSPFDENSENSCFAARSHDTHCWCYEA